MTTATRQRPKPLLEYAPMPLDRVDRARGVVRGVKIIGRRSQNTHRHANVNGTEYDLEGLREAIPLYEGAEVYSGHPDPDEVYGGRRKPRPPEKKLGKLINVRLREDGLYGDLVLDTTKELSRSILEAATDPLRHDLYSLSHNADGLLERRGDKLYVPKIHKVYSVDVVGRGGSNKSLFEALELEQPMTTTLRALLESASLDARLKPTNRKRILSLLEQDDLPGMDAEMPAPEPMAGEETADPETALREGFKSAIMACLDGEDEVNAMVKKIKDLLKAREQALGAVNGGTEAAPEPEPTPEGDDMDDKGKKEDEDEDDEEKPYMESAEVKSVCELAGVKVTQPILESLCQLTRPAALALIKQLRDSGATVVSERTRRPTSSAPGRLLEHKEEDVPTDRQKWLARYKMARRAPAETN